MAEWNCGICDRELDPSRGAVGEFNSHRYYYVPFVEDLPSDVRLFHLRCFTTVHGFEALLEIIHGHDQEQRREFRRMMFRIDDLSRNAQAEASEPPSSDPGSMDQRSPRTWRLLVAAAVACLTIAFGSVLGFSMLGLPGIGLMTWGAFALAALTLYFVVTDLVCQSCGGRFPNRPWRSAWFGDRTFTRCPQCRGWRWCRVEAWHEVARVPPRPGT